MKVVLVESQKPPGDVERVVAGAAGDGVWSSIQADLKDDKKYGSENLKIT